MKKAKFIRKYYGRGYDRDFVYMDYEYRGHEYTVYENRAKGNEPLAWQHKGEQLRIDRLVEKENAPKKLYRYEDSAQYGLDCLFECWAGDEEAFDRPPEEIKARSEKYIQDFS